MLDTADQPMRMKKLLKGRTLLRRQYIGRNKDERSPQEEPGAGLEPTADFRLDVRKGSSRGKAQLQTI